MLVVSSTIEVVGDDRAVGSEGDDDVDVAREQRLILQTEVEQPDLLERETRRRRGASPAGRRGA